MTVKAIKTNNLLRKNPTIITSSSSLLINKNTPTHLSLALHTEHTTYVPLTIHNASISAPPAQCDKILTVLTLYSVFWEELLSVISEITRDRSCDFPDAGWKHWTCRPVQSFISLYCYLTSLDMTEGWTFRSAQAGQLLINMNLLIFIDRFKHAPQHSLLHVFCFGSVLCGNKQTSVKTVFVGDYFQLHINTLK